MADSFEQFEMLVREAVAPSVIDLVVTGGDVIWSLLDTFHPRDTAGRDTANSLGSGAAGWFAEWRIRVQRGGTATGASFGSSFDAMGADDNLMMGQAADNLYPDPVNAPVRSYLPIRMSLKRFNGVYPLNIDQIQADLATQPIESVASGVVEDVVLLVRNIVEGHIYSDGGAALARVDNSANITLTKDSNTKVPIKEGTYNRFAVGQRYVAGSHVTKANFGGSTRTVRGGTAALPARFRVVDVDPDGRDLYCETEPGFSDIVLQDGDDLMLDGMFDFTQTTVDAGSKAIEGFESLLINTGNFPGATYQGSALSVTNHRKLQAFIQGDESNPVNPTPAIIDELSDKMADAGKESVDVVIGEKSLWSLYAQIEREAFSAYPVSQGAAFVASGRVTGPQVGYGDKVFARLNSAKIRPGSILGLTPSVWMKFIPLGDRTIKWLYSGGNQAGASSIFGNVSTGRQATNLAQAPFDFFFQIGCTDPQRNFRRIGINSQRALAGT